MKVCVCVCRLLNKEIGTASEQPGSVGRQEEENLFAQTLGISENPKNPPPPKKIYFDPKWNEGGSRKMGSTKMKKKKESEMIH